MIYLDTGVLVRALLEDHPLHNDCVKLLDGNSVSSCHAIAETFNTLTGFFQVPNDSASELLVELAEKMHFEVISRADYLKVVQEARAKGIQGGIVYDAIHASVARRLKVEKVFTYNATNFRHVAADLIIEEP